MVTGIDLKFTFYFYFCSRCTARHTLVYTRAGTTV